MCLRPTRTHPPSPSPPTTPAHIHTHARTQIQTHAHSPAQTHVVVVRSVRRQEVVDHRADGVDLDEETHLLLAHARELEQEGEVLREVLALWARPALDLETGTGHVMLTRTVHTHTHTHTRWFGCAHVCVCVRAGVYFG